MVSKNFFFTLLYAGFPTFSFQKASNKEPDNQMDMVLYPPDEESTSKIGEDILYGNTNIPSRQSRNLFRKRWIIDDLDYYRNTILASLMQRSM
jgi:hypothetical protein